ncbi:hypothetical protein ACS0TY_024497 [Phlomoides rotata]
MQAFLKSNQGYYVLILLELSLVFSTLRLIDGRYVTMGEQVTLFLSVLSHHSKVRIVKFNFKRSAQTIHHYFHNILRAILKLHNILLAKPTPVDDDALILAGNISRYISKSGLMEGVTTDQVMEKLRNRNDKGCRGWSIREEQMVEATEEQWAAFMKKDHNVRLMRHKSWPLYKDWCEIFGQSRATGEGAESYANADTPPPSYSPAFEADYGFDKVEKLRATALIARNTEDIDVFFSLPTADRMEWVLMILNGDT